VPAKPASGKSGQGAPNVLWILLDDVGYGASSTFGGLVDTPNLDALAAQGLRYTNFHTTAISSPTRAALLTGRNHHSVGVGLFPETATDAPGYNARIPASKATVAEILKDKGYNTFAVGKWHRRRWRRPARAARSTAGQPARASSNTTASCMARLTSGTRNWWTAPSRWTMIRKAATSTNC
jgi:arylsulfatase A-like enzyme